MKGGDAPMAKIVEFKDDPIDVSGHQEYGMARLPDKFAVINRLIMRDLNNPATADATSFLLYTKEQIATYLKNPYKNEKQLRKAVIYLYGASSHFRRLIQYFVSLSDLSYVVGPYKTDTATAKPQMTRGKYRRVLNLLASMNIKDQFEKILTVCLREDVFYGTIWETSDSVIIQQLPSDYCAISVIEDNVLNVSFDFSYFRPREATLDYYPEEFRQRYEAYKKDVRGLRWQELSAPNSFAIKTNKDILAYAIPPFVGLLREIFDLEKYRELRLTKEEIENYALLVMRLGLDDEGNYNLDYDKAVKFFRNMDAVLPEEIGAVLSPMDIDKISFERTHPGTINTIEDAEQNLFTAAGVSSLLFNNAKAKIELAA